MPGNLGKINRFVVLMMENRSFDHLVGYLKTLNPAIEGLGNEIVGNEFQNFPDPPANQQPPVTVSPTAAFTLPFDPPHEFADVQAQLYGCDPAKMPCANTRVDPALMNGFLQLRGIVWPPKTKFLARDFASWNVLPPARFPAS